MGKIYNQKAQNEKRRALRQRATYAERLLWNELKGKKLAGFKFRRQFSVGPHILDFYCPELKLAIEIDGISHDTPVAQERDSVRQQFIERYGIRFLRVRDEDIRTHPDRALEKIREFVNSPGLRLKT
jgi:very-short-patch-repair endonuclease